MVWSREAGDKDRNAVSTGDYLDWKRESTVFQILGVVRGSSFNLSIGEKPQQVLGDYLTPGFLDQLIGDRPFMGRYFAPEEGTPGKDHVVIITHKLWKGYFSSDPNIISKQIHPDCGAVLGNGDVDLVPRRECRGAFECRHEDLVHGSPAAL